MKVHFWCEIIMASTLLMYAVLLLSAVCVISMLYAWRKQPSISVSISDYVKLSLTGIISFIADTLGIGSFAVNIALSKLLGTFSDEELPAVNNGAQVIPGAIESLFFISSVAVDLTTMLVLITGACIGGIVGGNIVSRLSKQAIRGALILCFAVIIIILTGHLIPVGGDLMALTGMKLFIGFFAMMICGALTSVGIGLFVLVQVVLFLLNASPIIAFPIMMTAGAMQQPLTTLVFLQQGKIPLKKTLILSFAGCIGVFIGMQVFPYLTTSWLHTLLLGILLYNLLAMSRTFWINHPYSLNKRAREAVTS